MALFPVIALIDAESINPEKSWSMVLAKLAKSAVKVVRYLASNAIDEDGLDYRRVAPDV